MIEQACIFNTNGIILFQKSFSHIKRDLVDDLIKNHLKIQKNNEQSYKVDIYEVNWSKDEERNIIFMIAHNQQLQLKHVDIFFNILKQIYIEKFYPLIIHANNIISFIPEFEEGFIECVKIWQKIIIDKRKRFKMKKYKYKNNDKYNYYYYIQNYEQKEEERLEKKTIHSIIQQQIGDDSIKIYSDSEDDIDELNENKGILKFIHSLFVSTSFIQYLDENKLKKVIQKFKEDLLEKNVNENIAEQICVSIKNNLINYQYFTLESIYDIFKQHLIEELNKIITPLINIDIITESMKSKELGKPYIITFVGANGVGKSTNVAKIAYLLKSQGFSVMIAVCDTQRLGAIEQLQIHGKLLNVPVFERGRNEEPSTIAYFAIKEATAKKIDILLIDTAGTIQYDQCQMKYLNKLILLNKPDLTIFTSDALVGNDGSVQLKNFNTSLITNQNENQIKQIDAIILSKFDIVENKVGTALNLIYETQKPILFFGVGQDYTQLKKFNTKTIVNKLLNN